MHGTSFQGRSGTSCPRWPGGYAHGVSSRGPTHRLPGPHVSISLYRNKNKNMFSCLQTLWAADYFFSVLFIVQRSRPLGERHFVSSVLKGDKIMDLFLCVLMVIYKAEECPLKLQWWLAGTNSDRELRDLSQRQPFDFPSCPLCLTMGAPGAVNKGKEKVMSSWNGAPLEESPSSRIRTTSGGGAARTHQPAQQKRGSL